jgi:hypothetical protein
MSCRFCASTITIAGPTQTGSDSRMRRWGHGHSLAAGALFGLVLSRRPELVFAAGLACGVALAFTGRAWAWGRRMFELYKLRPRGQGRAETIPSSPSPVYRVYRVPPENDIPY